MASIPWAFVRGNVIIDTPFCFDISSTWGAIGKGLRTCGQDLTATATRGMFSFLRLDLD